MASIGIPIKLLHEAGGHVVTVGRDRGGIGRRRRGCGARARPPPTFSRSTSLQVELKTGETLRGDLAETEDNWNLQLKNATATARDGRVSHVEHVFVRGSRVR